MASPGPDPTFDAVSILRVFISDPFPGIIASEVARELDGSTTGVKRQMDKLVEQGLLQRKEPGPKTHIYAITPAGRAYFAEHALPESSGSG